MIWEEHNDFDPEDYSWNIDDEKIWQPSPATERLSETSSRFDGVLDPE